MTSDDLRRIFMGQTLFRLDTILSPRLVPVLYVTVERVIGKKTHAPSPADAPAAPTVPPHGAEA